MCLYAVRRETRDKLPAVIPLQFKTLACKRALAYPKPDTGPLNAYYRRTVSTVPTSPGS
jgi:hypothetical protein